MTNLEILIAGLKILGYIVLGAIGILLLVIFLGYMQDFIKWIRGDNSKKSPHIDFKKTKLTDRTHFLILDEDSFLYIENNYHPIFNEYILINYEFITELVQKKGYKFIYLPKIIEQLEPKNDIHFIKHNFPILNQLSDAEIEHIYNENLHKSKIQDIYDSIIHCMRTDVLKFPTFIFLCRNNEVTNSFLEKDLFQFDFDTSHFNKKNKNINNENHIDDCFENFSSDTQLMILQKFFEFINLRLENRLEKPYFFFQKDFSKNNEEEKPVYDIESKFYEIHDVDAKFKENIDSLFELKQTTIVSNAIIYMLLKLKNDKPELISNILKTVDCLKLPNTSVIYLSRLFITKKYEILFTDYGNKELILTPLAKTVYLFFLKHPEGVIIKRLCEHKTELLEIYKKLSNKSSNEEIIKAIDDLVDSTNPSINQKCSRIREALLLNMNIDHTKYYIITGNRGLPYKISLPIELISYES